MFTVQDIQRRYNVTVHTVLGWIAAGELRAINVGRRLGLKKPRYRISQEALEQFETMRMLVTPPLPRIRRRKQSAEVVELIK